MNRLQRAFAVLTGNDHRSTNDRFVPIGGFTSPAFIDTLNLNAGSVHVSPDSAVRLATVFRCVDLLSSTAAYMPWSLMQKVDGIRKSAIQHPSAYLYSTRPHPETTSFVWRKTLFVHALLYGNAYARITRNGVYRPVSLKIVHPNKVAVTEYNDALYYSFDGGPNVPSSEVLHLKLFSLDGLVGRSVIRMAADSLKIPMQGQRFAASFLENGARVSGVLTHPGKMKDEAKSGLKKAWQAFVGSGSGGTPILDEGVKYEQIGLPPGDFQLLDLIKASDETICTWFGVPQHLAGILTHATFSNIEHQDLEYMKYSLDPHLVNLEQEADYKILRSQELGEYYSKFNRNAVLRTDIKTRYEAYRTGIQNGFMSQNQVAELEDWNPIPGGERYWIQQNMMPLDSADDILQNKSGNLKRLLRTLMQALDDEPPAEPAEPVRQAMNGHKINGNSVPTTH